MDKKRERLEYIRSLIKMKIAVTIDDFFLNIQYCEKTLRRDIKHLNGITSYTHRGKFITLPNIPVFDENGIWYYKDIGFTKYRNSLDLIVSIIENNEGITKEKIESILKIKISKQIQILLKKDRLHRVKVGAKYFYLSENLAKNKKRQMQVIPFDIEDKYDRKVNITDLIAVLKVVLTEHKIDMNNLKKLINKHSLQVPIKKIEQLFFNFDLSSKKKH